MLNTGDDNKVGLRLPIFNCPKAQKPNHFHRNKVSL